MVSRFMKKSTFSWLVQSSRKRPCLLPLLPQGRRGPGGGGMVSRFMEKSTFSWLVQSSRKRPCLLPLLPLKGGEGRGEEALSPVPFVPSLPSKVLLDFPTEAE